MYFIKYKPVNNLTHAGTGKRVIAAFDYKDRLVKGELRFIFVVDIYNEGVDIPEVNTVLFLRPTESLTIFLQQLGVASESLRKKTV